MRKRIAIIATHPIQYYSPWFRWISAHSDLDMRAFFLSDFSTRPFFDQGFGREISWDVPLLEGFEYEFVPNVSPNPGSHHFRGLINPLLRRRVAAFDPAAVLLFGYKYHAHCEFLLRWRREHGLLMFRGDSHRLEHRSSLLSGLALHAVFSRFDRFLYVGKANRDYFRQHGVPENKLVFAPHAIDNQRFSASPYRREELRAEFRDEHGIAASAVVLLFAGKLEKKKRPDLLISAFRRLPREMGLVLLMAGEGPMQEELHALAAGEPRIRFLPFQQQSAMPALYAASDVTILPSEGAYETWGLCVNESFSMGVPAIVSTHVGCGPDLVESESTGLIFRAGDVDDLAAALLRAASDGEARSRWSRAAQQRILGYSYERATEGLIEALGFGNKLNAAAK